MQWLIARYQPASLFSLKHGDATSSGGKSLLIPTPFAIRMALLDVAIRLQGIQFGEEAFQHIKGLRIAVQIPDHAAVAGIFVKIIKPERKKDVDREMASTIAFREYVHLAGELVLALAGEPMALQAVELWLPHVTYFGKRGSFFQLLTLPYRETTADDEAPGGFTLLAEPNHPGGDLPKTFPLGLIQRLDDWGDPLTFDKANVYDRDTRHRIRLGRERIRRDVILPYRLERASRGYSLYTRVA